MMKLRAPSTILALIVVGWLAAAAVVPGLLTSHNPLAINMPHAFSPPGENGVLGTDELGRDIYARIVYGARESLAIGLAATGLGLGTGLILGTAAGLTAGTSLRIIDALLTWMMNVLFALPTLVLALSFIAIRGPGVSSAIVAIGLATSPGFGRMVRAQVVQIRRSAYVQQSITLGESPGMRLIRHILPNTLGPLISMVALGVAQSIVWVCALSFLGLGALPPAPEWGAMLNAGRTYLFNGAWMMLMPGLAITVTALAFTVLGRAWARGGAA